MTVHDDTGEHPFDIDNRAYQRFQAIAEEHFDALIWNREDGRPVMLTLRDLPSGDIFTMAIIDSLQIREPHTLLAFTTTGELAAHGPFDTKAAAVGYAAPLAFSTDVAATRPAPLHHPEQVAVPDTAWYDLPPELAAAARATCDDTGSVALILLDRAQHVLAAIGPFTDYAAADAWQLAPASSVDRIVVALHHAQPELTSP